MFIRRIGVIVTIMAGLLSSAGCVARSAARPARAVIENLGPMVNVPNGKRPWLGPLAPTPDGTGFVQLIYNFPAESKGLEIVAVDLQTGAQKRSLSDDAYTGLVVGPSVWGPDGKLYLGTLNPPHLIVWDPRTQKARNLGRVWENYSKAAGIHDLVVGTDGAIYGGGENDTPTFRYDPRSHQLKESPPLGLPRTYYPAYSYSVGADERFTYAASGKQPWYLVAYDRQTGEQRNLIEFDKLDFPQIVQQSGGVYAKVSIAATKSTEFFKLENGRAARIASIPADPSPRIDPLPAGTRPAVDFSVDSRPSDEAFTVNARLRYRLGGAGDGQAGWQQATIRLSGGPSKLTYLGTLPDGRIFGSSWLYSENYIFDPATDTASIAGPAVNSMYASVTAGDKLYFSGYPSTGLFVYDPAKPYNATDGANQGAAASLLAPQSNPRRLIYFADLMNTHYGYYMATDAAGRIYVGAHAERIRVGGGLGVYDRATGGFSAIGEPELANYDVAGLAATLAGDKILYSSAVVADPAGSTATPQQAKLFLYDPELGKFSHQWSPLPGTQDYGHLVTGNGRDIVGIMKSEKVGDKTQTTIYRFDVDSGQVVQTATLHGRTSGKPLRGPDGNIWLFVNDRLMRVNPDNLNAKFMTGTLINNGFFTFSGADIYIPSVTDLLRIKGIAPL